MRTYGLNVLQGMIVILILLIFTPSYIHIRALMSDTLFGAICRVHGHEKRMVPFCLMHGPDFSCNYLYI